MSLITAHSPEIPKPSRAREPAAAVSGSLPLEPETPPQPFIKWAGGKRALLAKLAQFVPRRIEGTYFEPFVGGGALYFDRLPERAILSDVNRRLVRTWRAVRDETDALVERLADHQDRHAHHYYYRQRERSTRDIDAQSDVELAAWFIYLNKTAFNGLYRVNRKNGFNVPIGSYTNPRILDEPRLRACARVLQDTRIEHQDFAAVLDQATAGDFVYFDPPYVPKSATSSFTSYSRGGFDMTQQVRLRDTAVKLKRKGVSVLLSNSCTTIVRDLYRDHFELRRVLAPRAINSKGSRRGGVYEYLIY